MIRFSALLVAVATVLLIAGVVTSKLALVYVAIGMSALALATLGAGAGLKRHELFGQAAGSSQAGMPVPSEPSSSVQPEAVSVAASGSTGADVAAVASSTSSAGTRNAAPWESGAIGWGSEAGSWGIEAPSARERTSAQGRGLDSLPASSAWPPAPAASSWSAVPEAGRFETSEPSRFGTPEADRFGTDHPAPGLAAYAPPVGKPEHARPAEREVPAREPVSSTASWSAAFTPPSALADARRTAAIPVHPAPEGPRSDPQDHAEDANAAPVDTETTAKPDDGSGVRDTSHPAPGLANDDVTQRLTSDVAKPGSADAELADAEAADVEAADVEAADVEDGAELDGETSWGAGVGSAAEVAGDEPADVSDDARAATVSATDEGPSAQDASGRADRTMILETTTVHSSSFTTSGADPSTEGTGVPGTSAAGAGVPGTGVPGTGVPGRSAAGLGDADLSIEGTEVADARGETPTGIDSAKSVEPGRGDSGEAGPDASALDSPASLDSRPVAVTDSGTDSAKASPPEPAREVTIVPGVPRYHDASCILIRFMGEEDLEKTTLAAAVDLGCTPCRACLPEQDPV